MKTQALKGMRDLLPAEQTLRDYIQGKILETYRASGFERISTPMLEDMENLDKSDGGDNLNLIFKVLKRGDKLTAALNTGDPKQLSDMGLRYDLTLPLSRYYAANKDKLPSPFKVIQTDRVFRAAASGSSHSGGGNAVVRAGKLHDALCHFRGAFHAVFRELLEHFRRNMQDLVLYAVRVGADSQLYYCGASRNGSHRAGYHAAGAAFRRRYFHAARGAFPDDFAGKLRYTIINVLKIHITCQGRRFSRRT